MEDSQNPHVFPWLDLSTYGIAPQRWQQAPGGGFVDVVDIPKGAPENLYARLERLGGTVDAFERTATFESGFPPLDRWREEFPDASVCRQNLTSFVRLHGEPRRFGDPADDYPGAPRLRDRSEKVMEHFSGKAGDRKYKSGAVELEAVFREGVPGVKGLSWRMMETFPGSSHPGAYVLGERDQRVVVMGRAILTEKGTISCYLEPPEGGHATDRPLPGSDAYGPARRFEKLREFLSEMVGVHDKAARGVKWFYAPESPSSASSLEAQAERIRGRVVLHPEFAARGGYLIETDYPLTERKCKTFSLASYGTSERPREIMKLPGEVREVLESWVDVRRQAENAIKSAWASGDLARTRETIVSQMPVLAKSGGWIYGFDSASMALGVNSEAVLREMGSSVTPLPLPPMDFSDATHRPNGFQIPGEGDRVFQRVRGFGGAAAIMTGVVERNREGVLRVKPQEVASVLGLESTPKRTSSSSIDGWIVQGDPLEQAASERPLIKDAAEREATVFFRGQAETLRAQKNDMAKNAGFFVGVEDVCPGDVLQSVSGEKHYVSERYFAMGAERFLLEPCTPPSDAAALDHGARSDAAGDGDGVLYGYRKLQEDPPEGAMILREGLSDPGNRLRRTGDQWVEVTYEENREDYFPVTEIERIRAENERRIDDYLLICKDLARRCLGLTLEDAGMDRMEATRAVFVDKELPHEHMNGLMLRLDLERIDSSPFAPKGDINESDCRPIEDLRREAEQESGQKTRDRKGSALRKKGPTLG